MVGQFELELLDQFMWIFQYLHIEGFQVISISSILCKIIVFSVLCVLATAQGKVETFAYMYCGSDTAMFYGYTLHYLRYLYGDEWVPQIAFTAKNRVCHETRADSCIPLQCGEIYELSLQNTEQPRDFVPNHFVSDTSANTFWFFLISPDECTGRFETYNYEFPLVLGLRRGCVAFGLLEQRLYPFYIIQNVCGDCVIRPHKRMPDLIPLRRAERKRSNKVRR